MSIARTFAGAGLHTSVLVALQALALGSACAAELEYRASLGAGHSDNIRRTETNEVSEDIATAGLQFSADQRTAKLQADVVGDLAYYDYRNHTYDSEVVGNALADIRYSFVPQRFDWVLTDNFGQVLDDPFAPPTPDNRENINYFATGPDLTMAFGSQTRLRLSGRYALTTYETSPLDSDSALAELALIRLLSGVSSVSLHARAQQVRYDEASLNGDYDQGEAFVRYEAEGARTRLSADLGYTELKLDAGDQKIDGPLVRLNIQRRLSSASVLTFDGGSEFTNSGSAFAETQGIGGIGLGSAPGRQTVQPFTLDHAALTWDFQRNRTGFSLFGAWEKHSYDEDPILDQTTTTFGAALRRQMSPATSLTLNAAFTDATFEQPGVDYQEVSGGVGFDWRLSRAVSVTASYEYVDRNSDLAGTSYKENRFWLSIGFGRGDPRNRRATPQFAVDTVSQPVRQP